MSLPKVSGQIEAGKVYKVFAPNGGVVRYNNVDYAHAVAFPGINGIKTFTLHSVPPNVPDPQVRFKNMAPWTYLVQIGNPSDENKRNTYVTFGSSSTDPFNRFLYYDPDNNLVPNILTAPLPEVEAKPEYSPKDGVSVQYY